MARTILRLTSRFAQVLAYFALATLTWGKETYMLPMLDGVRLSTDAYLPEGSGPWPVVLIRTPYVKAKASFEKTSSVWTKDGWVFIVQDTRGRGDSQGKNLAYEADGWASHHDGADTLKWIAQQSWCDGHVATAGASALAIAELLLAGTGAQPLSAQHIQSGTPSLYDGIYRQGVFRKTLVEEWLKMNDYDLATLRLWRSHSSYDDFWAARDLSTRYRLIDAPAVHEGGWFDIFTQGTIDSFLGYNEHGGPHARGRQRLIMSPGTHALSRDHVGQLVFPHAKEIPTRGRGATTWLDYAVRGIDAGIGSEPPVTYYVMGDTTDAAAPGNFWRRSDRWPRLDVKETPLYLHADRSVGFDPAKQDASLSWESDPNGTKLSGIIFERVKVKRPFGDARVRAIGKV